MAVDSAAAACVAPTDLPVSFYLDARLSSMRFTTASGQIVNAAQTGTTTMIFAPHSSDVADRDSTLANIDVHLLNGAKHILFAVPVVTKMGHMFSLLDFDHSLLHVAGTNTAIILRRQFPHADGRGGHGLWFIDVVPVPNQPGQIRILNDTIECPTPFHRSNLTLEPSNADEPPSPPLAASLANDHDAFELHWSGTRHPRGRTTAAEYQRLVTDGGPRALRGSQPPMLVAPAVITTDASASPANTRSSSRHRPSSQRPSNADVPDASASPAKTTRSSRRSRQPSQRQPHADVTDDTAPPASSKSSPSDTPQIRVRRSRLPFVNGAALHMMLGHPTSKRLALWKLMADGFPRRLRSFPHRCHGCEGRMRRRAVPTGTKPSAPTTSQHSVMPTDISPLGSRWFMDFKDFAVPDVHNFNSAVVFVEYYT
jgi:hypothetical protein